MSAAATLHVITFSYHPFGGVVKTFDYAHHALDLGLRVSVSSPEPYDPGADLFGIARLSPLTDDERVTFHSRSRLDFGPDDLALISLPPNYDTALASLPPGASPERIIHLVQNTRHANPRWLRGYPLRLLTRPAARIATSPFVADAIAPWLDPRALMRVNLIGHDLEPFSHERTGGFDGTAGPDGSTGRPLRVAYTTWKSEVGDGVARSLQDDDRFEFRAIRTTATWSELRDLYTWSDVFLSTPNRQEGTYLPGLEAMAAGSIVVTPDAGGNMDYCMPGENCLLVGFGDVDAYRAALLELAAAPAERIAGLRGAGYGVIGNFTLARERDGFAAFLEELRPRLEAHERRTDEIGA